MLPSTSSPAPAESVGPVATMQGTLWKWTNYLSGILSVCIWISLALILCFLGWQPRWFVLEGGSLAYFLSPNEVHLGSRGSLKVSSCDILGKSFSEDVPLRMSLWLCCLISASQWQPAHGYGHAWGSAYLPAGSLHDRETAMVACTRSSKAGTFGSGLWYDWSCDIMYSSCDCHVTCSCAGNVSRGTDLQKKMKDLQNHCQLLVSQIASIQTMTSDPTTLNSEVGIGSYLLW